LARGQNFIAALRFEKLLAMDQDRARLSDLTIYKAALAFQRAGDRKSADAVWQKLEAKLQNSAGMQIGDDMVPLAKLKQVLAAEYNAMQVNPFEWPVIRGDAKNTAQASGSPPLLDTVLWRRPLVQDKHDGRDTFIKEETRAKARIDTAIDIMRKQGQPIMSGFFPVATKGLLIYRTHSGIRAIATKQLKGPNGHVYQPGQMVWSSIEFEAGLANLLDQNNQTQPIVDQWLGVAGAPAPNPQFPQPFPGIQNLTYFQSGIPGVAGIVYENSTIGTLATDHQFVYAVDDLAVPPPYVQFNQFQFPQFNMNTGEVGKYARQNMLNAYNIERQGKLEWELGGKDDPLFADSHFLGVPISVGGKLYVLNEKNPGGNQPAGEADLRLVCIDPTKKTAPHRPAIIEPVQLLGLVSPQNRVSADISRRTSAVHLAFGEGILVCPTNAGEVFGVDLMNRSLVWSYPYREQPHSSPFQNPFNNPFQPVPPKGGPPLGSQNLANWKTAPPAIADGKVVFTAPDASSVHCINLRDGTPVWKSPQLDGDLFLAGVYNGKVLIVGKTHIRALNLQDKRMLWSVPTNDLPSGQGIASKGVYYLPLSKGEILAINIDNGSLKAHNRAAGEAAKLAPGNLVFYEGCVLSLTPTDVVAYPQLTARLEEAAVALKADPENLEKLTNHGELLLKDGQVMAAVTDLEKVVARKADGAVGQRAKDRLHEALTDLLQTSFNDTSEKYLDLYKELCKATDNDSERQMRQAKYFRIVGQGREAQGNLVEAFQMYKDFGALPIHSQQGGIASLDDPTHKVPTHVWLRGRVSGMIAKATPEQRAPLEAKITQEWKEVLAKKDLGAIRSFVGMFDVPFEVGREARLYLAETIMERNEKPAYLEAELNLQQLLAPGFRTDPGVGGRALASLALLEEKKGTADSVQLAASYYREVARNFGKVEVRKGKTGADLFNELPPKIYLPYLEEPTSPWGNLKIAARKLNVQGFVGNPQFVLTPEGDLSPFARQHRLTFDANNGFNTEVRCVDITTGKERWKQPIGQAAGNNNIFSNLYNSQFNMNLSYGANARHRFYHVKGHLMVAQIGLNAYCFDGDNGKVLWKTPLVEGLDNQPGMNVQPTGVDAEGNPEFVIFTQFGQQRRLTLGHIGAVQASYVAMLTPKGLIVNDPLQGTMLWKKMEVPLGSRVFGDEEYLFLVESGEGTGYGAGRVYRAIDGAAMDKIADFGPVFQNRLAINGRQILAAVHGKKNLTLRLYDIVAGKDVWSKDFALGSTVLNSESPTFTGVMDPKGAVVVLDVATGREVIAGSVLHGKIGLEDVKQVSNPLLLADADRFYLALNRPTDAGKVIHNNFSNGVRCQPVNGWVLALHRKDGVAKVQGASKPYQKGSFAWHSFAPLNNQMLVLDQFDQLPVLLFSVRSLEQQFNNVRWQYATQSISKHTGKFIYDSGPEFYNAAPQFVALNINHRTGTIDMAGYNQVIQHYIDDGRKVPQTTGLAPGATPGGPGIDVPVPLQPPGGPGVIAPPVIRPRINVLPKGGAGAAIQGQLIMPLIRLNERNLEIQPAPVAPPAPPPAPAEKKE
jgi:outer membrane protein assembly factor BamB